MYSLSLCAITAHVCVDDPYTWCPHVQVTHISLLSLDFHIFLLSCCDVYWVAFLPLEKPHSLECFTRTVLPQNFQIGTRVIAQWQGMWPRMDVGSIPSNPYGLPWACQDLFLSAEPGVDHEHCQVWPKKPKQQYLVINVKKKKKRTKTTNTICRSHCFYSATLNLGHSNTKIVWYSNLWSLSPS